MTDVTTTPETATAPDALPTIELLDQPAAGGCCGGGACGS